MLEREISMGYYIAGVIFVSTDVSILSLVLAGIHLSLVEMHSQAVGLLFLDTPMLVIPYLH